MNSILLTPLPKPVVKEIEIPGSKSYTNRALILSVLTKTNVSIVNPLSSDDTMALLDCLKVLGITITVHKASIDVKGSIWDVHKTDFNLNAKLSGTTLRFLMPVLSIIPGKKMIQGEEGLNKRPIAHLVDALRTMGAQIEYVQNVGFPPVIINSSALSNDAITLNGSISSQYFSGLLMIAPIIGGLTITINGVQISKPYIDMTIQIMKEFGVDVQHPNTNTYIVPKGAYTAREYTVEGDFSSAGYFFAVAALTKSIIKVKNLNPDSAQADKRILPLLKRMGNKIVTDKNSVTIHGKGVKPVTVSMIDFPDQAQTIAVLASFAKGTTILKGIQSLRVKETERVIALQNELVKMGIQTHATNSILTIYGGNPHSSSVNTYADHRMAMSFAVAGAKLPGIAINDPDVVDKTYPEFWKTLASLGIKTKTQKVLDARNIVLLGMRGSGKSTIAKLLAEKLNREELELDAIISQQQKRTTAQIVEQFGWDYFRDLETTLVKNVSKKCNTVISTGGGVVVHPENTKALAKNGILIFLDTSIEVLTKRMRGGPKRPPLTAHNSITAEIKEINNQRQILYQNAADFIIDTNHLTPNEVVDQILLKLSL